jgi:ribosome biogenesis GTPase
MDSNDPLLDVGLTPAWQARFDLAVEGAADVETIELGRVIRQDRGFVLVATRNGTQLTAVRPRHSGVAVVGDWVSVQHEGVRDILDRESMLVRRDSHSNAEQPVVANVDLVVAVCGVDRPVNIRRIERAVTQAWQSGASPLVVLSKIDLVANADEMLENTRTELNVDTIGLSSRLGDGLEQLHERMIGKTSVMIGESGAGKSTLLNALLGNDVVATGDVRSGDSKGRHTTTRRELHVTQHGIIIDTPGVRSLGLWADEESIAATFPDLAEIAENCKFSDCAHTGEPGCAVAEALENGKIESSRVDAWLKQLDEVRANELRMNEHERRKTERKSGRLVDEALRMKKKR